MKRLAGTLALLLLAAAGRAEGDGPSARIALFIGIDEYVRDDTIHDLHGCVNDIDRLAELMLDKYGFRPPRVRVLRNEQATRDAIRESLWWLVDVVKAAHDAGSRDIVVLFAYAGHGGLVESKSGEEKRDSTILPTDAGRRYERHIRDDDLNRILGLLQDEYGAAVVQVMDSCHSGTAYRSTEVGRVRSAMLPGERPARSPEETMFDGSDGRPALPNRPNVRLVYLGAVLDSGLAEEGTDPAGNPCGKFSWSLYRVLSTARPGLTYGELHAKLLRQFREDWRNSKMLSPAAISPSLRDTLCFGGATAPMHARMLGAPDADGRVALSLGSIHGVTEGAVFRFYRDESDLQDRIGSVGQATVVEVGPTSCVAKFEKVPATPAGVPLVAALDAALFPAFRVAARGELAPWARAALERLSMPLVEPGDAPDLLIDTAEDGVRLFLPRTILTGTGTPAALFGPLGPRDLEDTLSRYARVQRLLGLARNEGDVEVRLVPHAGSEGKELEAEEGVRRFRSGALLDLSVANPRDKPVYVYGFVLEEALDDPARTSFAMFFPGEDPSVVCNVAPGATLVLDDDPEEPGVPVTTDNAKGSRLTLKFLVTEKPYPASAFTGLAQRTGGARGDADDLQWFLRQAAGGRAGARDAGDALRGWWATTSLVLDVLP